MQLAAEAASIAGVEESNINLNRHPPLAVSENSSETRSSRSVSSGPSEASTKKPSVRLLSSSQSQTATMIMLLPTHVPPPPTRIVPSPHPASETTHGARAPESETKSIRNMPGWDRNINNHSEATEFEGSPIQPRSELELDHSKEEKEAEGNTETTIGQVSE